jgi:hypothetical protein
MPNSLTIQLCNQTTSDQVYAYITGLAIQHNGARVLLKSNGRDLYFPTSPPAILQPLVEDCAIPLGAPGNTVTVQIPQMAGGRIWFSRDARLTFLLNPGPALVEPSVLNPTDPNAKVDFSFCEFTLNNDQLFANISYVDFVPRLPIALTLQTLGGAVQHVSGMPPDGLGRVCDALREQAAKDGRPWDKLVVGNPAPLRALSPTHGNAVGASFGGYFEPLVEEVWSKYCHAMNQHTPNQQPPIPEKKEQQHGLRHLFSQLRPQSPQQPQQQQQHPQVERMGVQQLLKGAAGVQQTLRINTQAAAGIVSGSVDPDSGDLVFGGECFKKPSSADILGCNSGPFATGPSPTRNAIIPRLAAAFQRSSIVDINEHPSHPDTFYKREPTNHYCRIVHECNLDGKGYAFAYDDVQPDGGEDQSGKVNAGDPKVFIVAVGGMGAYVGDRMP